MTEIMQGFLTEIIVGAMLAIFGLAIRSWTGALRRAVERAVARVEAIASKIHAVELDHGKELAAISRDITNLYKRLDRAERVNGVTANQS